MRRAFIGVVVAFLTALVGVALATLWAAPPAPQLERTETPAPVPTAQPAAGFARLDYREVFHDFDFVGSCSAAEADARACAFPHRSKASLPKPEAFEAGRRYVFHYPDSTDRDLLFEALENRFRSLGFETDLSGPVSGMRLHPNVLVFEGREHAGMIVCGSHRTVSKGGRESYSTSIYDFTLVYNRVSR